MATSEKTSITDSPNVSKEEKRRLKKERKRKRREASTSSCTERTFRGSDEGPLDAPAWAKGFEVQDLRLQVALLPRSLGSHSSVSSQVSQSVRKGLLFKYHQATGGIAIAFRTIELVREGNGWIRHELPHIHFTAEVQALVFCPEVGMEVITKIIANFQWLYKCNFHLLDFNFLFDTVPLLINYNEISAYRNCE
jgi:hypothetical protein